MTDPRCDAFVKEISKMYPTDQTWLNVTDVFFCLGLTKIDLCGPYGVPRHLGLVYFDFVYQKELLPTVEEIVRYDTCLYYSQDDPSWSYQDEQKTWLKLGCFISHLWHTYPNGLLSLGSRLKCNHKAIQGRKYLKSCHVLWAHIQNLIKPDLSPWDYTYSQDRCHEAVNEILNDTRLDTKTMVQACVVLLSRLYHFKLIDILHNESNDVSQRHLLNRYRGVLEVC